jgi:hypothetical protein
MSDSIQIGCRPRSSWTISDGVEFVWTYDERALMIYIFGDGTCWTYLIVIGGLTSPIFTAGGMPLVYVQNRASLCFLSLVSIS